MKWKTASFFSILIFFSDFGWLIYRQEFLLGADVFAQGLLFNIFLVPVAWWIGSRVDKIRKLHDELRQSKEEVEALFNIDGSFLWSNDLIRKLIMVSKGVEKTYGYTAIEFEENYNLWSDRIHPEDKEIANQWYEHTLSGCIKSAEWKIISKNGELRWVEVRATPTRDKSGSVVKLNGVAQDITERKHLENKLRYEATHDMLTGLPNRKYLNNILNTMLQRAKQNNSNLSVLFLDLDQFKIINDTRSHDTGDKLLQQVANRLMTCVQNLGIAARQSGDEFILILNDTNEEHARDTAQKILDLFIDPFIVHGEEIFTSASIGISLYPRDGSDSATLLMNADAAMYVSKKRGRNTYQFFIQEAEETLERKIKLEQDLRRGLLNSEFTLYYQPQIELTEGRYHRAEALIRWNHPELGLIYPAEFIPIAEETGWIVALGNWVIKTACKQMKAWEEQGFPIIRIAVNVSATQFQDQKFAEIVKEAIEHEQVSPENLELELTESIMFHVSEASAILQELKQMGVHISIDDFGTGYSSLSLLNRMPIDTVKIDRSFIQQIESCPAAAFLVKTIIDIGSNLCFDVIAEGVENEKQADQLMQYGCHLGQGYLYGAPMTASDLQTWWKKRMLLTDQLPSVSSR